MDAAQLRTFQDLQELPMDGGDSGSWIMCDDVLDGTQPLKISHEGGELSSLQEMQEEWAKG